MPSPPLLDELLALLAQRTTRAVRKGAAGFVGALLGDAKKVAEEINRRASKAEARLREMDPSTEGNEDDSER